MENFSICPAAGECGGCSYQGVAYENQLKNKEGEVKGYLRDSGVDSSAFAGIKPCLELRGYRNKMEYTFGNSCKDGPTILGLHKKKSFMSVVDTSECSIVPEDFDIIVRAVDGFVAERGYVHFNKKFHSGMMRNLILRKGFRTNEILVNIVTCSQPEFDEKGFVELINSLKLSDRICGILHTINDSVADTVSCDEMKVLQGRPYYEEIIMGLRFKVGAFSFFQTNVAAAERLYQDAISLIDGLEGKTVYDLYCGTGTITQAMAKKAKRAIGVEIVEDAVKTARESAAINGLDNCTFIADDVQHALASIEEKPDVIVVDPPRAGMQPKAVYQVMSYGVKQIVYISCNPKTMAENLRGAVMNGYQVKKVTAYDNFPMTKHTECIVLLEKAD